jgi:dihydrofolate reductase
MSSPIISSIVSIDEMCGIGKDNKIPWNIPKDRKWFKEKTMGHVVIMGKNTFLSIVSFLGKPLPGRINIVVTNDRPEPIDGVNFIGSIEEALSLGKKLEKNGEIFFIGGATIYKSSLKYASRLYVTLVKGKYNCDTFFPDYSEFRKETFSVEDSDNGVDFVFKVLERN